MKKKIFISLICLIQFIIGNAQENEDQYISKSEFQKEISEIKRYNYLLKIRLNDEVDKTDKLEGLIWNLTNKTDSLNYILTVTKESNKRLSDSLSMVHNSVASFKKDTKSNIDEIDNTVTQRTLYWIIVILSLIILAIAYILYVQGRFRTTSKKFISQINRLKNNLNADIEQAQKRLSDIIDQARDTLIEQNNQTKKIVMLNEFIHTLPLSHNKKDINKAENQLGKDLLKSEGAKKRLASSGNIKIDHSLAIKMANEIFDIKKKINSIPDNTKGLEKLKEVYERIEKIFNEIGYEVVESKEKPVTEAPLSGTDLTNAEKFKKIEQLFSRVTKPQVNYKGEMIQSATFKVNAVNEKG
jgi:phenylalanyl-tRNA synthetase alpha subunit